MSATTVNAWEHLARKSKAEKIADTLRRVLPTITAAEAGLLDDAGRRAASHLAQVKPASDETWTLVCLELGRTEPRHG